MTRMKSHRCGVTSENPSAILFRCRVIPQSDNGIFRQADSTINQLKRGFAEGNRGTELPRLHTPESSNSQASFGFDREGVRDYFRDCC